MPTLHSPQDNAKTQAWRQPVPVQPHDQNDRQTNGRRRTPQ